MPRPRRPDSQALAGWVGVDRPGTSSWPRRWRTGLVALALWPAACGSENGHRQTVTVTGTGSTPPGAATKPRPPLATYQLALLRVRSPWPLTLRDAARGRIRRSEWHDPRHRSSYLRIDAIDGETTSPATKAAQGRAVLAQQSDYRELSFAPVTLGRRQGFVWVFRLGQEQRVDYFLNDCRLGLAVLGVAPAHRFQRLAPVFRQVAASVKVTCARQKPPSSPQSSPSAGQAVECGRDHSLNAYGGDIQFRATAREVPCAEANQVLREYWRTKPDSPAGWRCHGDHPYRPGALAYTCLSGANSERVVSAFWARNEGA